MAAGRSTSALPLSESAVSVSVSGLHSSMADGSRESAPPSSRATLTSLIRARTDRKCSSRSSTASGSPFHSKTPPPPPVAGGR
eukprot:4801386-Prymnesium_polylepis.1